METHSGHKHAIQGNLGKNREMQKRIRKLNKERQKYVMKKVLKEIIMAY